MRRLIAGLLVLHALFVVVPPAAADEPEAAEPPLRRTAVSRTTRSSPVTSVHADLPARYAKLRYRAPVYETLADVDADHPYRWLTGYDTWVSVYAKARDTQMYRTNLGWIAADALTFASPSALQGVDLREYRRTPVGMVYWPEADVWSAPGVSAGGSVTATLKGYDVVSLLEERQADGVLWYRIGKERWIQSTYVRIIEPGERPERVGPNDKWIEVDLSEQVVMAHEGDTPIYATLSATGIPSRWPTVQGLFQIWVKLDKTRMRGGDTAADAYYLADVPWTMYFFRDYGIHGTYWHDAFGAPRSHGCVNLSPADARWFFEWAEPALPAGADHIRSSDENPGTWVWVHR